MTIATLVVESLVEERRSLFAEGRERERWISLGIVLQQLQCARERASEGKEGRMIYKEALKAL